MNLAELLPEARTATSSLVDGLALYWRSAPRRWGHPLHGICSYLAMFPPQLASVFIRWLTDEGDSVYDPFSGRGTVALEAVLQGRNGYGIDANPLAHALTKAKVRIPSASSVSERVAILEDRFAKLTAVSTDETPEHIAMLYSPRTLEQLCFLRAELTARGYVDPFIVALALGMLHANHSSTGATRGFSISMPNTFAMAPGYVRDYIRTHGLKPPDVNVFQMLRDRVARYQLPETSILGGGSWLSDASREPIAQIAQARPRLIFTSPPYLQVIKYGKYNWVRLWFLKQEPTIVDAKLMASSSLARYLTFMADVLRSSREVIHPEGYVGLVIGDVRRGTDQINLAEHVRHQVAEPQGWHYHGTIEDELPATSKVSRIWKDNPGRATKIDRILLLSPKKVELPAMPSIDWSWTPELQKQ